MSSGTMSPTSHIQVQLQAQSETQTQTQSANESEKYEHENVHRVYDQIAAHFSETRYKPWPIVEKFLQNLPDGAVGLDVGCGNGKYLKVNPRVFIVGSDRSENLIKISTSSLSSQQQQQHHHHFPHTSIVADTLSLPHPRSTFDFVISIAVIHHLSTPERRVAALAAIFETLRPSRSSSGGGSSSSSGDGKDGHLNDDYSFPRSASAKGGGQALIYVWALEQKTSRRGWDTGDQQDVMVPWVMSHNLSTKTPKTHKNHHINKNDKDNNLTEEKGEEEGGGGGGGGAELSRRESTTQTFNRYYHLYRRGELEDDIRKAGGYVERSGYERDNWWAVASVAESESESASASESALRSRAGSGERELS